MGGVASYELPLLPLAVVLRLRQRVLVPPGQSRYHSNMSRLRQEGWKRVYAMVKRVPKGCVVTYGRLARMVQLRGGARAAGRAMAVCPSGRGIPWHRVVGAGGRILIREPQAALQRRLLESEGVRLAGGRVDLAQHEWRRLRTGLTRPERKRLRR